MSEFGPWTRFALSVLAVWRVTHLLAREDGPGDVVYRLRRRLGETTLGRLMDCFYGTRAAQPPWSVPAFFSASRRAATTE